MTFVGPVVDVSAGATFDIFTASPAGAVIAGVSLVTTAVLEGVNAGGLPMDSVDPMLFS